MVQLQCKTIWQFLKKLNVESPYDPVIPLLGTHSKEWKAGFQTKIEFQTKTWVFIVTLVTRVKRGKQPRYSPIDEWINKMWYIYTMEYFLATRRTDVMMYTAAWMNLKSIILSERSQTQNTIYCVIPFTWDSTKSKTIVVEIKSLIFWGWGSGEGVDHRGP